MERWDSGKTSLDLGFGMLDLGFLDLGIGISDLEFVSLKVYDLLGNEIKTLVNEIKSPGVYKVVFDGSNLSSGMYFYKMFVNENLIDGKRMLLLK